MSGDQTGAAAPSVPPDAAAHPGTPYHVHPQQILAMLNMLVQDTIDHRFAPQDGLQARLEFLLLFTAVPDEFLPLMLRLVGKVQEALTQRAALICDLRDGVAALSIN